MRDSSRSQVAGVIAAVSGVIAYQWVRNDGLAYGRALVWGGWLFWSVAVYLAWGVIERRLTEVASATGIAISTSNSDS